MPPAGAILTASQECTSRYLCDEERKLMVEVRHLISDATSGLRVNETDLSGTILSARFIRTPLNPPIPRAATSLTCFRAGTTN
jgi:hypothetical protein